MSHAEAKQIRISSFYYENFIMEQFYRNDSMACMQITNYGHMSQLIDECMQIAVTVEPVWHLCDR